MDISQIKAEARKAAFATRSGVHNTGLDGAANENLLEEIARYPEAEIISAYMAMRTEIDPTPAMKDLHAQGKKLCVPVIDAQGQPLAFVEWAPDCEMVEGTFGALVPAAGARLQPDLVISPLLTFDSRGYRLGYGGGFYDRTFEALRAEKPVVGIGFAYSAQHVSEVPVEPTDYRLDAVVTESEILRF
ncbi:5-formyltetrahydrofolate cyclo-ligase [Neptunicoccus cionae]|uniref:5-formyltetrahydrofolate cyclo-ligase n=1 Tax=Neptunicoccus cionae TaxID=2035344 RepID=A0A916R0P1_9RHOB|nr:5-formyltetrahydrofolate cyclo-ligase [Amylibacter cionae]GGA28608.1 5-formyltetrahydrofolate cyclo-ligase [Amylibacter cionae]